MKLFFLLLPFLLFCKAYGLYLLVTDYAIPEQYKRKAYHQVLAKEDYPVCLCRHLYPPNEEEINAKLHEIHPSLNALWVPTSLFQLFAVSSYFNDLSFQKFVQQLGYSHGLYDKNDIKQKDAFHAFISKYGLSYQFSIDDDVVNILSNTSSTKQDLFAIYETINHHEELCSYFLKFNDDFVKNFTDFESYTQKIISQIPHDIQTWQQYNFPFLYNADKESLELFFRIFSQNKNIIKRAIDEEIAAKKQGKQLLYRGADLFFLDQIPYLFMPLKTSLISGKAVQDEKTVSFSLSYANSLFGSMFLSIGSCAARYSDTLRNQPYAFHAVKVDGHALLDDPLFCIPPIHPFAELFVDGEWSHPHTMIAKQDAHIRCNGWYAKQNQFVLDHLGFLKRQTLSADQLGYKLLQLAQEACIIHFREPSEAVKQNS